MKLRINKIKPTFIKIEYECVYLWNVPLCGLDGEGVDILTC